MKKYKVAIYSGEIPATPFIEVLIEALAREGHQVYLFGNRRARKKYKYANIRDYGTPKNRLTLKIWFVWNWLVLRITRPSLVFAFRKTLTACGDDAAKKKVMWIRYLPLMLHPPDIFHLQWARNAKSWVPLKSIISCRLVVSFRGAHINYVPLAEPALAAEYAEAFPAYDGFHAVSQAIATEAARYGAAPGKTRVIHSGIQAMPVVTDRTKHAPQRKVFHILSAGRFHWKKGYPLAIDAVHKLVSTGHAVTYEIIAGGNAEEVLYQVRDYGLEHVVSVRSSMPQRDLFSNMAACDLFLLPSYEEGIANVVLEAMACGALVLSSDCGGMNEAVREGANGLLFRSRDLNDLTAKIQLAMAMPDAQRKQLVENAKTTIADHFSAGRLGSEMTAFYNQLLP